MPRLTTVKVQYESKIKIYGQNLVYGEDLRSLTLKTKNWDNNHLSRRFGKYSFQSCDVICWNNCIDDENFLCLCAMPVLRRDFKWLQLNLKIEMIKSNDNYCELFCFNLGLKFLRIFPKSYISGKSITKSYDSSFFYLF